MAQGAGGPGGIDFDAIRTREELVPAFDHVSLDQIGEEARSWNHRVIADQFAEVKPAQAAPANELAGLYERARYAPQDEDLSAGDFADARRDLRAIAGSPRVKAHAPPPCSWWPSWPARRRPRTPAASRPAGPKRSGSACTCQKVRPLTDAAEAMADPRHTMIVFVGIPTEPGGRPVSAPGLSERRRGRPDRLRRPRRRARRPAATGPTGSASASPAPAHGRPRTLLPGRGQQTVRPSEARWVGSPSPFDLFTGVEESGSKAVATDRPSEMSVEPPPGWFVNNLAGYPRGPAARSAATGSSPGSTTSP